MENNQEEKKVIPEPHVTVFGEEVGKKSEVEPQENPAKKEVDQPPQYDCRRNYCWCGRYDRCRCCGGGFGGLIVILVGIMLFLNSYGIVPWQVWNAMSMFWPALIIVIGLKIVLGRNVASRVVTSLIALVLVAFIMLVGLVRIGSPLVGQMHLPAGIMNAINQVK